MEDLPLVEASTNPVAMAHVAVPPALIEEVQQNPDALVEITRGQLALVQDRMVRKVLADGSASIAQLAVVHERLSKNAGFESKERGGGGKPPQVVINFIRDGERAPVTITAEGDGGAA